MKTTHLIFCKAVLVFAIAITGCDADKSVDVGCFTPCRSGTKVGGQYVACSDEGLMEGCFGNTVCENGWCVLDSEKASASSALPQRTVVLGAIPTGGSDGGPAAPGLVGNTNGSCVDDCGCGEHGTCIKSKCTTECKKKKDCEQGQKCRKKVCRQTCSAEGSGAQSSICPVDTTCVIGKDGENGVCMPQCTSAVNEVVQDCLRSTGGDLIPFEVTGGDLAINTLYFSENAETLSFELVNNTQCELDLTITKVSHTTYTQEGSTETEENALHWIDIQNGEHEEDKEIVDVEIAKVGNEYVVEKFPGDGTRARITISGVKNPDIINWKGVIKIGARGAGDILEEGGELGREEDLGRRMVNLSYSSGVDGQWAGAMFYFGNFGDDNIEEWINEQNPSSKNELAATVGNALVRRWGVVERGVISLDNFRAALDSTLTGAWNWSTVKSKCPSEDGACYPFADPEEKNDDGIEDFSDDLNSAPIPGGVVELPIVMNIKLDDTAASQNAFKGKIISNNTLHYAGDPNVTLSLAMEPGKCEQQGKVCKNDITGFQSDIVVGGRFVPPEDGPGCSAMEDFVQKSTPWLVEGFDRNTQLLSSKRRVVDCRDTTTPFEPGSPLLPP
ncbi:MAG: hypothetical protein GY847_33320, partial [Proteobacteria bacterium]|nr:hypothetical protein [Pseudomonadota bacterium]